MRSTAICVAAGLMLAAACASQSSPPPATTASPAGNTLGKFVWHDLATDDLAAARRFYGELLGWEFTDASRQGRPYVLARSKGRLVGGLVGVAPAAGQEVSQWVGYQSVANVDAAVAAVEKGGGRTLVAPVDLASGRAAVVIDPEGAPLGLVRLANGDPPDEAAPVEGTFFWMDYLARDPAGAAAFYAGTFGYEREVTERAGASEYVVLTRGRARGGILRAPRLEMRPTWLPSVLVADPAAMAARAASLGGTVLLQPRAEVRKGAVAVVTDPSGAMVALHRFPL